MYSVERYYWHVKLHGFFLGFPRDGRIPSAEAPGGTHGSYATIRYDDPFYWDDDLEALFREARAAYPPRDKYPCFHGDPGPYTILPPTGDGFEIRRKSSEIYRAQATRFDEAAGSGLKDMLALLSDGITAPMFAGYTYGKPAAEADIAAMESRLGIRFAADYRDFLAEFGCLSVNSHRRGRCFRLYGCSGDPAMSAVRRTLRARGAGAAPDGCYAVGRLPGRRGYLLQDGNGDIYAANGRGRLFRREGSLAAETALQLRRMIS